MHIRVNRKSRALVSAAVVLACGRLEFAALAQTSGTWAADVGTAGGSWSVPANWVNSVVPGGGGNATFVPVSTFTTAPLSIIQDQPTVTLSNITFNSFITYLMARPAGNQTNSFTLTGPATIASNTPSINTISTTTFGHQFQTPIAGSAGLTKTGPGTVTLWATNTYTGGTTVSGGILVARQVGDNAFGDPSGTVSLNDGSIRVTTSGWTSSRTINLVGNGTFESGTSQNIAFNGPVIGSGDLNKIGSNGLIFNAANSYSGATNVLAGTTLFAGNGAATNTSAVTARNTITLDNTATNVGDRINNAAPVTWFGSGLTLTGNASAASSETFGATTFSRGTTTVTITPGAGQSAAIATGVVSRDTGGAAFFRGTSLGAALGPNVANVTFAAAPTLVGGGGGPGSKNISIIPWAIGNTNATAALNAPNNSFVTYGANGVRPLDVATEFATTLAAAGATDNARIGAPDSVAAAKTINSLTLQGTSAITGAGTLSITSGALLNVTSGPFIDCALDFGSAEAMIFAPSSISFNGRISGTGGLTKQGAGVATFSNATNDYSGTTTIGGGSASFTSSIPATGNSAFGTGGIVLAPAGLGTGGTTARLVYSGTGNASFDRDLLVSGRIALNNAATIPGFGVNNSATLTMNGDIILDGSPLTFLGFAPAASALVINGDIVDGSARGVELNPGGPITDQGGPGLIALTGNNTFSGGAEMSGGTWAVGSNNAFGSGMLKMVQLSGQPTIRAEGGARTVTNDLVSFSFSANYWQVAGVNDISFTGSINLSGSYTHNINNAGLTTYAGVMHTGGFTKAGTGTLVLSGDNIYTGNTTISGGTLRVTHSNALGTIQAPSVITGTGVLELDGGAQTSEPVLVNSGGAGSTGSIRNRSGSNTLGDVTFNAGATIAVDSGTLATGGISGAAPTASTIIKSGPGQLVVHRLRTHHFNIEAGTVAVATGGDPNEKVSRVANLGIAGDPSPTATLDLGDNDLISIEAPAGQIENLIAFARNGGAWDQPGITSSAARDQSAGATMLGVLSGAEYLAVNGPTFDGLSVASTDVLVKYTWYGDTDFNGEINFDDYARIDNGVNNSLTGWLNGDFDLSGGVDFDDYVLIDLGFNSQNGTLRRAQAFLSGDDRSLNGMDSPPLRFVVSHFQQFGSEYAAHFLAAVPEPIAPSATCLAMSCLLRRRRSA